MRETRDTKGETEMKKQIVIKLSDRILEIAVSKAANGRIYFNEVTRFRNGGSACYDPVSGQFVKAGRYEWGQTIKDILKREMGL